MKSKNRTNPPLLLHRCNLQQGRGRRVYVLHGRAPALHARYMEHVIFRACGMEFSSTPNGRDTGVRPFVIERIVDDRRSKDNSLEAIYERLAPIYDLIYGVTLAHGRREAMT